MCLVGTLASFRYCTLHPSIGLWEFPSGRGSYSSPRSISLPLRWYYRVEEAEWRRRSGGGDGGGGSWSMGEGGEDKGGGGGGGSWSIGEGGEDKGGGDG